MSLENKLGLTSSADLAREEERISKKKALELFEKGMLDQLEAGKFSALKAIHILNLKKIWKATPIPTVLSYDDARVKRLG